MPPYIQPTSLLDLSLSAVRLALLDHCHQLVSNKTLASSCGELRQLIQQLLPAILRQRLLLQLATPADRPVDCYYLVGLLLGPDISQLRLEFCCYYGCSHQASLLKLLASPQAKSLTHLHLSRSALLRLDQCLLQSVLLNAEGLQHLSLRNIATDATLSAVGSSCRQLRHLDVANSRQITDQGIKQLFLQIELRNKSADCSQRNSTDCAVSITTTPRVNFLNRTARYLLNRLLRCLGSSAASYFLSTNQCLLDCFERQTTLCDTLLVLNLTNTSVTSLGVLIALENCTRLQSVGDYAHIHEALHQLELRGQRAAPLQLVTARNTITNQKALQLIFKSCPRLQRLSVMETRFTFNSPPSLLQTPPTLTSITLLMVPPTQQWLTHFYRYTHEHTPNLNQLTLVFSSPVNVQLDQLMQACSQLQYLTIDGANIDYYNPNRTTPISNNLKKIQLGQTISSTVVNSFLAQCRQLTVAHFYSCPDLRQLSVAIDSLECFYIYQTQLADTGVAVASLLASCPQLQHIGNLASWPASGPLRRLPPALLVTTNYQLQFEPGAHWYHSKCIKHYD